MKLRELINRLEELSEDGRYDDNEVMVFEHDAIVLNKHSVIDKWTKNY